MTRETMAVWQDREPLPLTVRTLAWALRLALLHYNHEINPAICYAAARRILGLLGSREPR